MPRPNMEQRIKELSKTLDKGELRERALAAEALGKTKHPAAVSRLVRALNYTFSEEVRFNIIQALGETGHPKAVPRLLQMLVIGNRFDRQQAIIALGQIGHPKAIPELVGELQKKWKEDREHVSMALQNIGENIQNKKVSGKEAKALQFVSPYFLEEEHPNVVLKAYEAALHNKIDPRNVRLYVKQLRAVKGNLK